VWSYWCSVVVPVQSFFSSCIDLLFPPRCTYCKTAVPQPHHLCHLCWQEFLFISSPLCTICGVPFETDQGVHPVCGKCLMSPPPYRLARSALTYNPASRKLIAGFKYYDKTAYQHLLGRFISYAGRDILSQVHYIVPVPLHNKRLFKRRYNQSALLALTLSRSSGIPATLDLLLRTKATRPQAELKRAERLENVKHAFRLNPIYKAQIRHKHLVLIDDVITTGATIHACSLALLKGGAKQVDVLTIARAPL
jgi:ComF family protein